MSKLITARGSSECRACGNQSLVSILDLGSQPLPAEYALTKDECLDVFPLHMRICPVCGLAQLGEFVLPERIFHDKYPYLSSASSTWIEHSRKFAAEMQAKLHLGSTDYVLELASNDGYLLSVFKQLDIPVLGIEPADNVAEIARSAGIPTITRFFGSELAKEILASYGCPRLIVANNVFAHIPDMNDFMAGISILAGDQTIVTIENPSFVELLRRTLFDTIYHEHYSYLTAHSVKTVARSHGLELINVDQLPTHGGSNRYWLSRNNVLDPSVASTLEDELQAGLFDPKVWQDFAKRANIAIDGLRTWFIERHKAGDVVVGYGAAHKGNTFLNSVGEASKTLVYVVDASSEKQGKFLPGSQVPVLSPEELISVNPTDVLILPWNIASELFEQIRKLSPDLRVWIAQPTMHQL